MRCAMWLRSVARRCNGMDCGRFLLASEQSPEWKEYHKGWPKAPPYGAPNAPPFRGWPQAPPYGMPAEWQSPDWSRTHVGWPPAPPMHVWNGKCETVIKDQQVVYVQSSTMKVRVRVVCVCERETSEKYPSPCGYLCLLC